MQLSFRRLGDGEMDRPPTQRDQFNNDDVELVDALVRESLQNSLDAAAEEKVRVRFSLHRPDDAGRGALLAQLDLEQLRKRLRACAIDPDSIAFADPKLLVIEDFGTTGLTGSWGSMDKEASEDGHVEVVVQQLPQLPGLLLPGLGDPVGEGLSDLLNLIGGEVVAPCRSQAA